MNVPTYRMMVNLDDEITGVFNLAMVESPAMEPDYSFVALDKTKVEQVFELKLSSDKKYIMGAIMIPNKIIPRIDDNGNHYNIYYTEQDISNAADKWSMDNNNNNIKLTHRDGSFIEATLVETWKVLDEGLDKCVALGTSFPKGSWVGIVRPKDSSIITEAFLEQYTGFSIEGRFIPVLDSTLEKQKIKTEKMSIISSIKSSVKSLFGISETKLSEFILADGRKVFVDEESLLTSYLNEDGTLADVLVDGEYEMEDGRIMEIRGGIFWVIKDKPAENLEVTKEEDTKLATETLELEDGTKLIVDLDTMIVNILNEDGTPGETPVDGEYTLADGRKLTVLAGVATITTALDETLSKFDSKIKELEAKLEKMVSSEAKIKELEVKLESLTKAEVKVKELEVKLETISKMDAKPVMIEEVNNKPMTKAEQFMDGFNKNKNKLK